MVVLVLLFWSIFRCVKLVFLFVVKLMVVRGSCISVCRFFMFMFCFIFFIMMGRFIFFSIIFMIWRELCIKWLFFGCSYFCSGLMWIMRLFVCSLLVSFWIWYNFLWLMSFFSWVIFRLVKRGRLFLIFFWILKLGRFLLL